MNQTEHYKLSCKISSLGFGFFKQVGDHVALNQKKNCRTGDNGQHNSDFQNTQQIWNFIMNVFT